MSRIELFGVDMKNFLSVLFVLSVWIVMWISISLYSLFVRFKLVCLICELGSDSIRNVSKVCGRCRIGVSMGGSWLSLFCISFRLVRRIISVGVFL